jgi:hypothetical protein
VHRRSERCEEIWLVSMFDPTKLSETKAQKKIKKAAIKQVKEWIIEIIPMESQVNLMINIEEIQCGDPVSLCPISSHFTSFFSRTVPQLTQ